MSELWTAAEIGALGSIVGAPSPANGVSIDTRTLQPGDLFFAIRGDVHDGHDFVRAGACERRGGGRRGRGTRGGIRRVRPASGRSGRARRARRLRPPGAGAKPRPHRRRHGLGRQDGHQEALRMVLGRFGETHASAASYNNHWGVPLTLARMGREHRFGVFEIGMNHAGEIVPLTRMVRPHVAIVTTVEPVHIGHFRSIRGIADAKGEIFGGLQPGGVAVITRDSPHNDRLLAHAHASAAGRVISFGEGEGADVRALRIAAGPDASMVEATVFGRPVVYRVGMSGRHVALNSLAVLATAFALGLDVLEAARAFADLKPASGRGERVRLRAPSGEFLLIDESFNANPASMRAALNTLALVELPPRGRRIAVLADMGELGEAGPGAHRDLVEPVALSGADLVFAAGPLMRGLWDALPADRRGAYAQSAAELEPAVLDAIGPGDAVMVKGSKYTLVSKIAATLKAHYGMAPGGPVASARS
jgi:UDP-N-acetylmuramoyl-tripeptide--D-alanyl-D-alanine ligase